MLRVCSNSPAHSTFHSTPLVALPGKKSIYGNYNKVMSHIVRIGSQIGAYDPFWVQVREAVYQKAEQLNVDLIPIEITEHPTTLSPEEQTGLMDELLAEDLGALICWNLPPSIVQRLLDLELPIISPSESQIRHPLFVSPQGLGQAARIVGEYFVEKLNGRGRVLC